MFSSIPFLIINNQIEPCEEKKMPFTNLVGVRENFPNLRVTFINGILNTPEDCRLTAGYISARFGFTNVHFVCDPTLGALKDLCDSGKLLVLEEKLESIYLLRALWRARLNEMEDDGHVIHIAHSKGGLVTELALKLLSEEEKKRVIVYSLGSPGIIPPETNPYSKNISNTRDLVPLANPWKWFYYLFPQENDKIIEAKDPLFEHSILALAYASEISAIADECFSRFCRDNTK